MRLFGLIGALLLSVSTLAEASQKVALVIGIGRYEAAAQLANPANDADAIVAALDRFGFDTTKAVDLDLRELEQTLRAFRKKSDRSEIALVYFSGHGIEIGGENFLLPTDARLVDERDVERETIWLETVLRDIGGASRLSMIVLDACRNNPFSNRIRTSGGPRNPGRGLGRLNTLGKNTFVMYATAPGDITPDGSPGEISPFTAAFLEALNGPPTDVRLMAGRAKDGVRRRLGGQVDPYVRETLGGDEIVLNERPVGVATNPRPEPATPVAVTPLQTSVTATGEAADTFEFANGAWANGKAPPFSDPVNLARKYCSDTLGTCDHGNWSEVANPCNGHDAARIGVMVCGDDQRLYRLRVSNNGEFSYAKLAGSIADQPVDLVSTTECFASSLSGFRRTSYGDELLMRVQLIAERGLFNTKRCE